MDVHTDTILGCLLDQKVIFYAERQLQYTRFSYKLISMTRVKT